MLAPGIKELRKICHASEDEFIGENSIFTDSKGGFYTHIDNGSNVLGVAHLDTVFDHVKTPFYVKRKPFRVYSPKLDDRLGVYLILRVLPLYDINVDVLLTTNEETMNSTAQDFILPNGKKYNWVFSFDRRGTDAVMYQYQDNASIDLLEYYGFTVDTGSYSDIADLERLEVKGFNFGAGYYKEHSLNCHSVWYETVRNVEKFKRFYDDNKDVHMYHQYDKSYDLYNRLYSKYGYDNVPYASTFYDSLSVTDYAVNFCSYCGGNIEYDELNGYNETTLCSTCIDSLLNGKYK